MLCAEIIEYDEPIARPACFAEDGHADTVPARPIEIVVDRADDFGEVKISAGQLTAWQWMAPWHVRC